MITSPGLSSVPASIEPTIIELAPTAKALATSPEYLIPPSAMIGIPSFLPSCAQVEIAVICGTPTPATIRVVQIEPGPIPTFTASAPASYKAFTASGVATFPAITSTSSVAFISFTVSIIPFE